MGLSTKLKAAESTLTASFQADPFARFLMPDAATRDRWLRAGIEFFLDVSSRFGEVHVTENADAALGVFPPGTYPFPTSAALRSILRIGLRNGIHRLPLKLPLNFLKLISVFEKMHPKEPHWYILVVGVHPDKQGRGLSRKVLQPILDKADANGLPCYLENSNRDNLPVYRKFGFEVIEEIRPLKAGPPAWLMLRKPRTKSA